MYAWVLDIQKSEKIDRFSVCYTPMKKSERLTKINQLYCSIAFPVLSKYRIKSYSLRYRGVSYGFIDYKMFKQQLER